MGAVIYEHIKNEDQTTVGAKEHIIELNGKRYDAITGKMVTSKPTKVAVIKSTSLDGFAKAVKPILKTGNTVSAHQTEKSKTLMRSTVKPPQQNPHHPAPANRTSSLLQKSPSVVSSAILSRSQAIKKSALVRRFSEIIPTNNPQNTSGMKQKTIRRVQAIATATAVNSDPISRGLANADSHNQQKPKKLGTNTRISKKLHISPRTLSASSLVLAGLIIVGFFAFQNKSNISMRLASSRASVNGTVPGYQPAGFGLKGGILDSPGQIVLGYSSNTDDRSYKITQSTSSWNSETLVENYDPLKHDAPYQTIQEKGKTVYLFDGSNATWVDGGIWYRIEGNSKLNSDQLLNIVNSL